MTRWTAVRALILTGVALAECCLVALPVLLGVRGLWGLFPFSVYLAVFGGRELITFHRKLLRAWYLPDLTEPYLPKPEIVRTGEGWYWNGSQYHQYRWRARMQRHLRWVLRDRITYTELLWLALAPLTLPMIPPAHARIASRYLGATEEEARLRRRVQELTVSRSEAVDASAAELRRIERDLHDGAQARLVAVGLTLGAAESLVDTDPARAKELLALAREASSTALTELRDLVRGIHPPVLAERGLADAVRAIALDTPLPVDVQVSMEGRPEAPVESAAYFAVCEVLANAVKHAGASRVWIVIVHDGRTLRITVTDDGQGGGDPGRGSGLSGVRRRLGTFDGTFALHSPPGGPTEVTMEIPCALSSRRTSTS